MNLQKKIKRHSKIPRARHSQRICAVWDIYDIVAPLVTRAVVAHAGAVRHNLSLPEERDSREYLTGVPNGFPSNP